jgi:1-acyl-sn-glycerol-3-phosphate acyltransferase
MIPIRSVLFSIYFYVVSFVMVIGGQVLSWFAPDRIIPYARLWSRVILAGLPIVGVRFELTGRENLPPGGPMLIASMHQSAFDTLLWFDMLPACRYVVKQELMTLPLFGRLARLSGQVGVDRTGGASTMRSLLREGGRVLSEGNQLVIFPEGTRVQPGQRVPLQPGVAALAKISKVPVIPVVTDSNRCWRRGLLAMHPGTIHIAICPPLPQDLPRDALMARLQAEFDAGAALLDAARGAVDKSVHRV